MLESSNLQANARTYLHTLCYEIPTRTVGTAGNRKACEYFEKTAAQFGFATRRQEFDCIDWSSWRCGLAVEGQRFEVFPSPYSMPVACIAPLVMVETLEDLRAAPSQAVLLLRGEIAKEQLMPKKFPFYNPSEHQEIYALLEAKQPQVVITAAERHPETAGAQYPYAMIEDGDFNIPSVYMSAEEGVKLAALAGRKTAVEIAAKRQPASGFNPIATLAGSTKKRVVVSAHIDAKPGTPGALDNAAGVVVLLLLAELMQGYTGKLGVELLPFNGEDHYTAAGQKAYLADANADLASIVLNINIDAPGYRGGWTAYSTYACTPELTSLVEQALAGQPRLKAGDAWYQGDHMVFMQNSVSAMALTSGNFEAILKSIAHTSKDEPALVDESLLLEAAGAVRDLITTLNQSP